MKKLWKMITSPTVLNLVMFILTNEALRELLLKLLRSTMKKRQTTTVTEPTPQPQEALTTE